MTRIAPFVAFLCLCACGARTPQGPQAPALPPLHLVSFLQPLKDLAKRPAVPEAAQKEVKELAEIALQRVEADPRTAARAERALLDHPHAAFALEPALADDKPEIRRRAAWLVGRTGRSVLQIPLLLRLKYELDPDAVLWVADALQHLGNDSGLLWLDAAMGQEKTADQAGQLAIAICQERGRKVSEPPTYAELQKSMREFDAAWKRTGVGGRPGVAAPDPVELQARFAEHLATTEGFQLRPIDDARYVLTRSGRLPLPLLKKAVGASEQYLRVMALEVLAEVGPCLRDAGPDVVPLLGDPLTSAHAVRALGEIGEATAVPFLRPLLASLDGELRCAAVQSLGLLKDQASAGELKKILADTGESLDVRVGAAFGVLCLGPDPAAEAFLAEREQKRDYHEQMLQRLREKLAGLAGTATR